MKKSLDKLNRREFIALTAIGTMGLMISGPSISAPNEKKGEIIKMAHELPPLPYDYKSLEPWYDEETLHLHHDKHHAAYVTGLNAAEEKIQAMLKSGDFAAAKSLAGDIAFHGSGHILHSIFWTNMKPNGGGIPTGALADAINKSFGSFDAFKGLLLATSNAVQGSGWGVLAYRKSDDSLIIMGVEKHENVGQSGTTPIMVLDVWEHAYYLKYQNKRVDWTKAFIENLVNWDDVAVRLAAAKS